MSKTFDKSTYDDNLNEIDQGASYDKKNENRNS